jgi:archaemetzincin
MRGRILRLVPLALQAEELAVLHWLGAELSRRGGLLPVQDSSLALDRAWLDADRRQYSSNRVVDALIARSAPPRRGEPEEWTLAITAADLFAPGREFVFGEAALGGAWAVLSLARLRDPRCPDDQELVLDRALKEALHELGHLARLTHCRSLRCVMSPSAQPADIDRKDASFCDSCEAALEPALDRDTGRD